MTYSRKSKQRAAEEGVYLREEKREGLIEKQHRSQGGRERGHRGRIGGKVKVIEDRREGILSERGNKRCGQEPQEL